MRRHTVLALAVLVAALAAAGVLAFQADAGDDLRVEWVSDTGVPVEGNHHGVAAGVVDGDGMVFAPRSGEHDTDQCALLALDAGSGGEEWRHSVPPGDCWIHAVATVTLGDVDGDGVDEVLGPTTENAVYAFHPRTGTVERRHALSSYGYSPAVVGALGPGSTRHLAVVDAAGRVAVYHPNGSVAWTAESPGTVWAPPAIVDVTGDDANELVVGFGAGHVTAFRGDGRVAWNTSAPFADSLTWMATTPLGPDGRVDVVAATTGGRVVALHGEDGSVRWSRDLGAFAAVAAVADGDRDGAVEVYAVNRRGELHALDAATGDTRWTATLTSRDVQMTPPPVLGDVDGDGAPDLVAVTNAGAVVVVDPASGAVRATHQRSVPLWHQATLADTDGDGADEVYVMYGDGRVVALSMPAG